MVCVTNKKSNCHKEGDFLDRFWNWVRDADTGSRTLYLDGVIAQEGWFDDDITPAAFRAELYAGKGNITVYINSPGGCVFASSQIYTMLIEYPFDVTVKVDGIAASAASVVAMAGTTVLMAPTAMLMVHNPSSIAIGDTVEMQKAIAMLEEVKETIITSYEIKTSLPRDELARMMDAETWFSANRAVELGFADGLILRDTDAGSVSRPADIANTLHSFVYSGAAVTNSLLDKLRRKPPDRTLKIQEPMTPIADLDKRLALLL
jgi:ATP-dependent Clp protease protease subunit